MVPQSVSITKLLGLKRVHWSSNNTDCICLKSSQELILISETALLTALYRISKLLIEF